jgi:sugar/nucleoside kinase (ribokinase family)
MARQRTIVGVGETFLVEHPDRTEASGLAALVAMRAVQLGDVGVVISRVGQDDEARELLALLREAGVDIGHVQSDPDLPTGRERVLAVGGRDARYLESRAAFDNLQWDFDLEDVAHQADAVVYGTLTRRSGQTRSEENRFVAACRGAVKVFDLTGPADPEEARRHALSGLEMADGAVVDPSALSTVLPGAAGPLDRQHALELLRISGISFVIAVDGGEPRRRMTAHRPEGEWSAEIPVDRVALPGAVVAFVHALLNGRNEETALRFAARVAEHVVTHRAEAIPRDWLRAGDE